MPVALYVTDANGWLTYYNEVAVDLWGRRPEIGRDRWCGSWRLYQRDGTALPHDQYAMAVALREGQAIQDVQAVVEQPDGTRVPFVAYPAPLRDPSGAIIGGSNVLLFSSASGPVRSVAAVSQE
ncbi:PAS domain-containing protein [Methylobacterium nigriterrae]|uniref:PAS domain-containing protein n=1 Tax=Methylobacterium nigriterrae TaxID=3127512 RepID=UPI0030133F5D